MKIADCGAGYVGLSLATLLSTKNKVVVYDIDSEKVKNINDRICYIKDKYIEDYFKNKILDLSATTYYKEALDGADYVIISTPTDYNDKTNFFDTSSVEENIKNCIEVCGDKTTIVIKSTIPLGFINHIKNKYNIKNLFYSPEFLREGKALYDNLYPSRIIVGEEGEKGKEFAELLKSVSFYNDVPILQMSNTEAEAVKLFSNTYLAMRVAYFNEIDTFAELNNLDPKKIIEGMCYDSRIGSYYNNPSFGYGGYCLPKDTKQLLYNFNDIPQNIIEAVVKSNITRKNHVANMILSNNPKVVGIYRLTMKTDSDNFRQSAVFDIINILKNNNVSVVIYEPTINSATYFGVDIVNDLEEFKKVSDIIVANRINDDLEFYKNNVYTRDLFKRD